MSKKNKSKKDTKDEEFDIYAGMPEPGADFMVLKPTPKTQEILKARRAKKLATTTIPEHVEDSQLDLDKVAEILLRRVDFIGDGKYGKAKLSADETVVINDFIKSYMDMDSSDEQWDDATRVASTILTVGKSYYEFDDKNREFISDNLYDGLRNKFQKFNIVEPNGIVPSSSSKKLDKAVLRYPTLSNNVDKAYIIRKTDVVPKGVKEADSVEGFLGRVYNAMGLPKHSVIELELSPKLDGVSLNGTIEGNMLVDPQTRGDDTSSMSVKGLNKLEIRDSDLKDDASFGIQYEVFVTDEERIKASEYLEMDPPYVSCRHAAAGIVRRLASGDDDIKLIDFLSFYPIATEDLDGSYLERMDYIQAYGDMPKSMIQRKVIKGDFDTLINKAVDQFKTFENLRAELPYDIDGMVVTVVNDDYQKTLGRNGRTNKYQIAMKFDPSSGKATVDHLEMECGNKGFRTLQIYFKPDVILDGVHYDHVPVLSKSLFDELDLRQNSTVEIHRVGDVIPSITKVDNGNGVELSYPKYCPVCGNKLVIKNKKLYCDSYDCKANTKGRFMSFFNELELEDYSDSFAQSLADGGIKDVAEIMELGVSDLNKIGLKGKKAEAFPNAVRKAVAKAPDYVMVAAMGLPDIGKSRAKMLLKAIPFNEIGNSKPDDITAAIGTDSVTAAGLASTVVEHLDLFKKMSPYVKNITKNFDSLVKVGHTGCKPSEETKNTIRNLGYEVVDGKVFDILLVPSYGHTSTKTQIANKRSLPIYTEEDFISSCSAKVNTTVTETANKSSTDTTTTSIDITKQFTPGLLSGLLMKSFH